MYCQNTFNDGGKTLIPLYPEHLYFSVTRAGWLVTKTYKHYTFEQSKFKKDFLIMNQNFRQKATFSVKKAFYNLLNNANFGTNCRNKIDHCVFELIYDEIQEIDRLTYKI